MNIYLKVFLILLAITTVVVIITVPTVLHFKSLNKTPSDPSKIVLSSGVKSSTPSSMMMQKAYNIIQSNNIKNIELCVDFSVDKLPSYTIELDNSVIDYVLKVLEIPASCTIITDIRKPSDPNAFSKTFITNCSKNLAMYFKDSESTTNKTEFIQLITKTSLINNNNLLDISSYTQKFYNNSNYVVYFAFAKIDDTSSALAFYLFDYTLFKPDTTKRDVGNLILGGTDEAITAIGNLCNK